jgi:putative ABC transport system permease protein
MAYTVARRAHEIGIRMALGATRGAVSRMVLGEALAMSCAGLAAGVAIAYWGSRLAGSLIADLPAEGDWPVVWGGAAMIGITVMAAYVPARRAARVDPNVALRSE